MGIPSSSSPSVTSQSSVRSFSSSSRTCFRRLSFSYCNSSPTETTLVNFQVRKIHVGGVVTRCRVRKLHWATSSSTVVARFARSTATERSSTNATACVRSLVDEWSSTIAASVASAMSTRSTSHTKKNKLDGPWNAPAVWEAALAPETAPVDRRPRTAHLFMTLRGSTVKLAEQDWTWRHVQSCSSNFTVVPSKSHEYVSSARLETDSFTALRRRKIRE